MSMSIELDKETRERLDKYVEERGAFPLHSTCETYEDLINGLLDKIERLEDKCERLESRIEAHRNTCELDREVLFDACLISIQKDDRHETVTECKDALVRNVALACGYDDIETRNRVLRHVEEHNKTRRYDNSVFQWRR